MNDSIAIFRGCALVDYANIASSPLATWPATLITWALIPHVYDLQPALQELSAYHAAAVAQPTRSDSFAKMEFWEELPFCFKAALEVAILFTSSEFCTRSEDVRETSVMMRFNESQRGGRSRFAERSRFS